jgi:hypothetical protein
MPTSGLDIWRSANELIKQHGEDAAVHAAMRAGGVLAKGDVEGSPAWKRIVRAINELLSREPPLERRPGVWG